MEATRYLDPGFWVDRCPVAPGASLPVTAHDSLGLVWFQTSGSIGAPRWLGLTRESLLLSAAVVNRYLGVRQEDVWGLALPLHHVGGFGVVARAHESGARLAVYPERWAAGAFTGWVAREGVNHVSLVPTQVHDLVTSGCRAPDALRTVVVGGGHFPLEMQREARSLGWPVLASYGMTECGSQVATQRVADEGGKDEWLPVLPHWQARVSDEGLLELKGDSLYAAMIEREGDGWVLTPREGDWFQTRDLAECDQGRLRLLGRADRRVKVLGELVDLEVIERKIGAGRAAVVALSDDRRENRLVLVCEGAAIEVGAYNRDVSGPWRIDEVVQVAQLPRTPLGKIRYGLLPGLLSGT